MTGRFPRRGWSERLGQPAPHGMRTLRTRVWVFARPHRWLLVQCRSVSSAGAAAAWGRHFRRLSLPLVLALARGSTGGRRLSP